MHMAAIRKSYRDLEAGDNQSLKFKWRVRESNPSPLAPQAKSLTNRPPLLTNAVMGLYKSYTSNEYAEFILHR